MKKLAIVITHPVQYYAPIFELLHRRGVVAVKVFYTIGTKNEQYFDPGFGKTVAWDIPLLEGYPSVFLENVAERPGSHHFNGIINPGLISEVNQFAPDAILFFGWAYQSHLKAIRHFKGKKTVYFRGDSTLLDKPQSFRRLLKPLFLRWIYKHIDHAFYVGTNNKRYFEVYGLKGKQLSFAPHAIDNDRFALDRNSEAKQLREALGIRDEEMLILFAGKFIRKKSPQLLLDAFLGLIRPAVHLLFVGDGELEQELKAKSQHHRRVHFMEFQNQSQMPVIYQSCDLFCLPSEGPGETWGLAVNEAMASGKAILVSDKVGCATDLVKEKSGAIFNAGSIAGLKEKIEVLTHSKAGLRELGNGSRVLIEDWNFTRIAETIEQQLINDVI